VTGFKCFANGVWLELKSWGEGVDWPSHDLHDGRDHFDAKAASREIQSAQCY
jgi:hypothetical protein